MQNRLPCFSECLNGEKQGEVGSILKTGWKRPEVSVLFPHFHYLQTLAESHADTSEYNRCCLMNFIPFISLVNFLF
jgi:hypothetical protein